MQIRIKKQKENKIFRLEGLGEIKEIMINEDLMHPKKESVSICFRGIDSSGIIDLTPEELEHIYNSVKSRLHLIKGMKTFKFKKE